MTLKIFIKSFTFFAICLFIQLAIMALSEWTHNFDLLILLLIFIILSLAFCVWLGISIFYLSKKQWAKLFFSTMLPLSVMIIYFLYNPIKNTLQRFHYRMVFNSKRNDYKNTINKLAADQPRFKIFYLAGYGELEINTDIYTVYDEKDNMKKLGSPTYKKVSKKLPNGICNTDPVGEHFYIIYACSY